MKQNVSITNIDYPLEHILWKNNSRLDIPLLANGAKCTWFLSQYQDNRDSSSTLHGWTLAHRWPINLIRPLFQRLGARKPKYFGKLDLTVGCHLSQLDEASGVYTAFQTIYGLYKRTRVPMVTKGSGSYFQRVIATTWSKSYSDDVLIDGADEDTFVNNVRQVFSIRSVPKTQNNCEPEGNRTWPRRGRICR